MEILEYKTNTGLIRERNEDCVLALKHPKNKNIKLLIAADGMGGKAHGDIASNYTVKSIEQWFIGKGIKTLNDTKKVERLLKRYIKCINTNLIKKFGENHSGTTLTLAIINCKETIFFNVGDSRSYIYQKKELIQITEDDSDVWCYYKYGGVDKDDLRYFSNNNLITACVGLCNELCQVRTYIIPNDYDMILLFTDGVTDLVTDKKIKKLIKKNKKEALLDKIIHEAVYVNQHLSIPHRLKKKYLAKYIVPFKGRDNASGVIFIKNV